MTRYLISLLLIFSLSYLSLNSIVSAIEKGKGKVRLRLSPDSVLRRVEGESLGRVISNVLSGELAACSLGLVLGEGDDEDGREEKEQEEEELYVAAVLRPVLTTSNPRQVCVFLTKLVVSVMT